MTYVDTLYAINTNRPTETLQTCYTFYQIIICKRNHPGASSYPTLIGWNQGAPSLEFLSQNVRHGSGTHYPRRSSSIISRYPPAENQRDILRVKVVYHPSIYYLPRASPGQSYQALKFTVCPGSDSDRDRSHLELSPHKAPWVVFRLGRLMGA